jgi:N-alpha-acetyl-L-2,4-diaminobutyrate deacetylase
MNDVAAIEGPLRSRTWLRLGFPEYAEGTTLAVPYLVLVGREREPRVLLLAGVHGDEYEGVAALQDLAGELDPDALKGTLTIVPVANPAAFQAGTRRSPIDSADLNRTFPGNPAGSISERLAARLFHEIVLRNDIFLSLHGWSKEATVVSYGEYPKGDSAAAQRSCAAAHALGLDYLHPYDWPKGVLGEAALQHGVAAVETEVGGMGTVTAEGQAATRAMILRFLRHLGVWEGDEDPGPGAAARIVDHVDCLAGHAGLFRGRVRLGETITSGALLGTVHSIVGEVLEEVTAPRCGLVAILRTMASVQPGDRLVQLFYWD